MLRRLIPSSRELSAPSNPQASHEQALFEAEYDRHFPFVWRSLCRLGIAEPNIDDAAQDVFIIALRRRHEFRGESSYRTWLFGVVSNVAREYRRKRLRSERHEPLAESLCAPVADPGQTAQARQALGFIDHFLRSLDDDRRDVFILMQLEQMSAPEAAAALGVKLNTVYSRLRSARAEFLLRMKAHFPEEHEQLESQSNAATRPCP